MDLQKFITESLVEIMTGIKDAQSDLKAKGSHSRICPTVSNAFSGSQIHVLGRSEKGQIVSLIEFDIAVEITSEGGGGGKISVAMGLLNAGADGTSKQGDKVASRLKFNVPVAYPDIAD